MDFDVCEVQYTYIWYGSVKVEMAIIEQILKELLIISGTEKLLNVKFFHKIHLQSLVKLVIMNM